jgi:hypothetical protein
MQNLVFDKNVLMKRGTFDWYSDLRVALHNVGYEVYFSRDFPANGRRRCFLTAPTKEFPSKDIGKSIAKFSPPAPYNELAEDYKRDMKGFLPEPRYVIGKGGKSYPEEFIQQHPNYS